MEQKALDSKFAYGSAMTRKTNEFEKVSTAQSHIVLNNNVGSRKVSTESLAISAKRLHSSPGTSDIDENEPVTTAFRNRTNQLPFQKSKSGVEIAFDSQLNRKSGTERNLYAQKPDLMKGPELDVER